MTSSRTSLRTLAAQPLSERTVLAAGLLLGAVLRVVQTATSIGSMDAFFWTKHVQLVEKFGVLRVYNAALVINHPPFALEIARWTSRIGERFGVHFFDSFRILQGLADIVTTLVLVRLARRAGAGSSTFVALAYFLSPAVIFISAFHCNSDPLMMMFIVLAIFAVVEERPLLGGVLIAAAAGIKIIAFPVLPFLFLACRDVKARVRFVVASALVSIAIFLPALVVSGRAALRNIFGYTGWPGGWGLPLAMDVAGFAFPKFIAARPARIVAPLLMLTLIVLFAAEAWRARRAPMNARRLPRIAGITFLVILFLAPGFGVQYFLWFLPFLAFLFDRPAALALNALVSLFVFWLYTSWAKGWPWVYAEGGTNSPAVGMFGLVVWLAIGCSVVAGLRHLYGRRAEADA